VTEKLQALSPEKKERPPLRDLGSNLAFSDATFLINLSNKSHLPSVAIPHNDDFVVAFTKSDEPLPRTDWCFFAEAIVVVVAAIRNVDFSHQGIRLLVLTYIAEYCIRMTPVSVVGTLLVTRLASS
jgi:hypothetical protein